MGEASNPGPRATWLSLNVGSWGRHWPWLQSQPQPVILLQEHLLLQASIPGARRAAKEAGWDMQALPATPGPHGRPTGGLACLVRKPWRAQPIQLENLPPEAAGRIQAVVVGNGGTTFTAINVYAHDAGQLQASRKNIVLRNEVATLVSACGGSPCLVGGDHQDPPEAAYGRWLGHSMLDVARSPIPTTITPASHTPRRLDYWLVNPAALAWGVQETTAPEVTAGVHLGVCLNFDSLEPEAIPTVCMHPKIAQTDPAACDHQWHDYMEHAREAWEIALHAREVDALWAIWCEAACKSLQDPALARGSPATLISKKPARRPPAAINAVGTVTQNATRLNQLAKLKLMAAEGRPQPHQQLALQKALERAGLRSPEGLSPEQANAEQLIAWAKSAAVEARKASAEEAALRREKQSEELRSQMEQPGSRIYRWLRGDTQQAICGTKLENGAWTTKPSAVAEAAIAAWKQYWCPEPDLPDVDGYLNKWWKTDSPTWHIPPLAAEDLLEALRNTNKKTAAGLDGWNANDLRMLPLQAWQDMASLLTLVEEGAPWPQGLEQAAVVLLPKNPGSGPGEQRPIALLSVIYRTWARARGKILRRELHKVLPMAVLGGKPGARVEDIVHELNTHVAYARNRGLQSAAAFLDLSKAYERIHLDLMQAACIKCGVPQCIWDPMIRMYRAPRRVRVGEAWSRQVVPRCGIPAGCPMAVQMMGIYLSPVIWQIQSLKPAPSIRTFVDDVTVWQHGIGTAIAKDVAAGVGILQEYCLDTGLVLQTAKCMIMATRKDTAGALTSQPNLAGFRLSKTVRDLGIDITWSGQEKQPVARRRREAAIQLAAQIRRLPWGVPQKALLVRSAVLAKALWGAAICPPPVAVRIAMRKHLMSAIYGSRKGIRNSAIALSLHVPGDTIDPVVTIPVAVILEFVRRIRRGFYHEQLLQELWPKQRAPGEGRDGGASKHKNPFRFVTSEVARIGWVASHPKLWITGEGTVVDISLVSFSWLQNRIWQCSKDAALKREATRQRHLQGLQYGIDEVALKAIFNSMAGEGGEGKAKRQGAARVIQQCGVWTSARGKKITEAAPLCPWCNSGIETLQHRWWECQAWRESRQRVIADPGQLDPRLPNIPAIWSCGLPIRGMVIVPKPMQGPDHTDFEVTREPVRVWTDGACIAPKDPRIRRAGWGLWIGPGHPYNSYAAVLGDEQTAYRGELRAVVAAAERFTGELQIASDNEAVVKTAMQIIEGSEMLTCIQPHSDLWLRFRNALLARHGPVQIRWVKGHRYEQGYFDEDAVGNHGADRLAEKGALLHAVSSHLVEAIKLIDGQMLNINKMQVEVLQCVLGKMSGPPVEGRPEVRTRMRSRRRPPQRQQQAQGGDHEPQQPAQGGEHEPQQPAQGGDHEPPQQDGGGAQLADDPEPAPGKGHPRSSRRRGPGRRRPPGLGVLAGPLDHDLTWLHDRIVCKKCGRAVAQKLRSRLTGQCRRTPRGAREVRNLELLLAPAPEAPLPLHEICLTDDGRVACTKCGRCVRPRTAARLASAPCAEPSNAQTRAWVRKLHGQATVPWAALHAPGNLGRGLIHRIRSALMPHAPGPPAIRRRITGKRPRPPEWG